MRSATGGFLLLAVVIASACAGAREANPSAASEPVEASAPALLADLCAAREASTDPATARTAFTRAHGPLHDLARDVLPRDRKRAAQLLEDKQRVEAALERSPGPEELSGPLSDLVESTRRALEAVGSPAPPCAG